MSGHDFWTADEVEALIRSGGLPPEGRPAHGSRRKYKDLQFKHADIADDIEQFVSVCRAEAEAYTNNSALYTKHDGMNKLERWAALNPPTKEEINAFCDAYAAYMRSFKCRMPYDVKRSAAEMYNLAFVRFTRRENKKDAVEDEI